MTSTGSNIDFELLLKVPKEDRGKVCKKIIEVLIYDYDRLNKFCFAVDYYNEVELANRHMDESMLNYEYDHDEVKNDYSESRIELEFETNEQNQEYYDIIVKACKLGHIDIVEYIAEFIDSKCIQQKNNQLLKTSLLTGHEDIFDCLMNICYSDSITSFIDKIAGHEEEWSPNTVIGIKQETVEVKQEIAKIEDKVTV